MFDPTAVTGRITFKVPAQSGNAAIPDKVQITDGPAAEFVTTLSPGFCDATKASVDLSLSGLITYTFQSNTCDLKEVLYSPVISLKSAAFSSCTLTAGTSTFPTDPNKYPYNQTVTGSLTADTVQLTAAILASNASSPVKLFNATWQLTDCPSVRPDKHTTCV
jgi:hypothetical protein